MTPRALLAVALLAATPPARGGEPVMVADTRRSAHALLRPVGLDEARWTQGLWAERQHVCFERSIPAMWELMRGSRYKPFYEHFLIAAGEKEGQHHGAPWNDGDFYKWIEAASSAQAAGVDEGLSAAVDEAARAVAAAQRADGYLHTPVQIRNRSGDRDAQPFSDRADFEVYNLGHLMTAGCLRYRVTGRRDLLAAAERAADFLEGAFAEPTPQMARQAVCPSHYMGLVELYRTTGERRRLELAERVLGLRGVAAGVDGGGGDDNQDRIPFVEQREAVGHAVRANYLYAGAADLVLETGGPALQEPLDAVWENVSAKKLYVTGACGALYDGASPDASSLQGQITRVHQAYGRNYQLPNITAHNETCAAVGAVLWNWRRFLATGDAKHIDWVELALYNAVFAGVSLEGTDYFYVNPLRVADPPPTELRWSRRREPFIVSYCCPPNVARTVAQLQGYAYAKSDAPSERALWVNLYGGGRLDTTLGGAELSLRQETRYPWDGKVRIVVERCPERWTLRLRRPSWAEGASLRVGGEALDAPVEKGYLAVTRAWRPGDVVELDLPMPVVTLESHPLVEETRNQLAVKRGPIVYCIESADLPRGVRVDQIALSPGMNLTPVNRPELLGGVVALEGRLPVVDSAPWGSLYRPAQGAPPRTVEARLVPYFAWGNRDPGEMTVWAPRR